MTGCRGPWLVGLALLTGCAGTPLSITDGGSGADAGPVGPWAEVYRVSPMEDDGATTRVRLEQLTDPGGALVGQVADVWNCVDEPGGAPITFTLSGVALRGRLCRMARRALPDVDGTYLRHSPAASGSGGDAFAEVMLYHHLTAYRTHLQRTLGLAPADRPVRVIVNLQAFAADFGIWLGFPNAGYIPEGESGWIEELIGVDPFGGEEVLAFGYNNFIPGMPEVDFAYDATIITHEYTHFLVGKDRLGWSAVDGYGLDASPLALNEGLADYFSASFLDHPRQGSYALGEIARDLTRVARCPDQMIGESHVDGQVVSGALWAARREVMAEVLDPAVWAALQGFGLSTTFAEAAPAILAELERRSPAHRAAVEAIFAERGLLACNRLKEHRDFAPGDFGMGYYPGYAGTATAPPQFAAGVPAYMQSRVSLSESTRTVIIRYAPVTGGFKGMFGVRGKVAVALRRGSEPIAYEPGRGRERSTAQLTLQGEDDGTGVLELVLAGACISGGALVFQFINLDPAPGQIIRLEVIQSEVLVPGAQRFDHCPSR